MSEFDASNPPAFPVSSIDGFTQHGMTLRDWFAGQALAGLLAGQFGEDGRHNFTSLPEEAFAIADAMLSARLALLVSQSLSCVNAPDIHHAGMRIIGFKVDLAAWPKSDLCMSFPVECLLELKGLPAAVERLTAELKTASDARLRYFHEAADAQEALAAALSQMEVMREALADLLAGVDHAFPREPYEKDGPVMAKARTALAPKEPQS